MHLKVPNSQQVKVGFCISLPCSCCSCTPDAPRIGPHGARCCTDTSCPNNLMAQEAKRGGKGKREPSLLPQ